MLYKHSEEQEKEPVSNPVTLIILLAVAAWTTVFGLVLLLLFLLGYVQDIFPSLALIISGSGIWIITGLVLRNRKSS